MRFIQKASAPDCFLKKTFATEDKWKKFKNPCKRNTKENILIKEQNFLCAYCEVQIDLDNSHIEHMEPQSTNKDKRFDYNNFIVSCNGKECHLVENDEYSDTDIHSCGHKKENFFDDTKFLNPTVVTDISDYFMYDKESGAIKPCNVPPRKDKAQYMINILNLDNYALNKKRLNTVQAFQKTIIQMKLPLKDTLHNKFTNASVSIPFITFLRFYYQGLY